MKIHFFTAPEITCFSLYKIRATVYLDKAKRTGPP